MNYPLLVIQYSKENMTAVDQYLSHNSAQIVFHHEESGHILADSKNFSKFTAAPSLLINSPHPDLLMAFFNLIPPQKLEPNFCIKSKSLISLMDFYQNLISLSNFKAIEMTYSSESKQFYGLLMGLDTEINIPNTVSGRWLTTVECLGALYNI